jgi:hypothetical protein
MHQSKWYEVYGNYVEGLEEDAAILKVHKRVLAKKKDLSI